MAVVLFTLPLLGEITLGTALGVVAGVAELLMAKGPTNPAPKAMTSAWGETWSIVYNSFRVPGKVLQAGELNQVDVKVGPGKKTNNYSLTFAVGICEGVVQLGRIWADNQVIYDPRPNALPPSWQANHLYGQGDQVLSGTTSNWIFTATVNGESGSSAPPWNYASDGATRDNEVVWLATKYRPRNKLGKQYNFYFTFYPGTETQVPDSSLEGLVGVGNQPAYRGRAYVVFYSFDLSRYGNRIPNFEFEVFADNGISFQNDGVYYGNGSLSGSDTGQFLQSDCGGVFYVRGNDLINVDTGLPTVTIDGTRQTADAAALLWPHGSFGGGLLPVAGKYFIALQQSGTDYSILLYEINCDGTATCIGCREYTGAGVDMSGGKYTGLSANNGCLYVMGLDFSNANINVAFFGTIGDMTGNYMLDIAGPRGRYISETTGLYAMVPVPYLNGFNISFVGDHIYIGLNKSHMNCAFGGPGSNVYYGSLRTLFPNGVMIKITLFNDGIGTLTYSFDGITNDFNWPFADEGKTISGGPGNTAGTPIAGQSIWDVWGGPGQTQDATGNILAVTFVRGYSGAGNNNLVAVTQFAQESGIWVQTNSITGAPFGTYVGGLSSARAYQAGNGIYLHFDELNNSEGYAKVGAFIPGLLTLADINENVAKRVGLTTGQLNYVGLESVIPTGVGLLQRATARNFIESMMPAFFFDLTDIGPAIVGTLRSNDAIIQTIPEDVLASAPTLASQKGTVIDRISSLKNPDLEIPEDMSITYYDSQHDYQQGSQQARRSRVTMYSDGKNTVSVPVVMTPWDANTAATRALFLLWVERASRKVILPPEFLARTAVDVVEIVRDGRNYVVRLSNVKLKTNWTIECDSVSEDLGTYKVVASFPFASIGSGSFVEGTINPPTTPILAVVDTATLRPEDLTLPGTYVAAANSDGGTYDTVTAQESVDDSVFDDVATLPNEAAIGTVALALGAPRHYAVWDSVNTITVSMYYGTLASADKWALTQDITTNLAWLSNGEILQFATATLNSDGTYTLSGLRRGRLGTEQFCNTHGTNETLVMLTPIVMGNVTYSAADINATRYWQALNDAPVNPASAVQTLTMTTRRLLPYAPTRAKATRDGPKNLTLTAIRRVRWHGQPLWHPAETDTPITQEVDIYNGMSVARTLTSTLSANGSGITVQDNSGVFTAYYAVADQIIDFGSAQASVSYRAYSRNSTIGRGYALAGAA